MPPKGSALSALVGMSTRLGSNTNIDIALEDSEQVEQLRHRPPNRNGRAHSSVGKATTEELRERIFTQARELQDASEKFQNPALAARFRSATVFSLVSILISSVVGLIAMGVTKWAAPSSNPMPTAFITFLAIVGTSQIYIFKWLLNETENNHRASVWDMMTSFLQRPKNTAVPSEGAHWLNDVLDSVWSFINPDIFRPLSDILELIILENAPPMVKAVGTRKIGQGEKPIRIVGIRRLPRRPKNEPGPTAGEAFDNIIEGGASPSTIHDLRKQLRSLRERTSVHMEFAFEYGATYEEQSQGRKSENIHILLVFHLVGGFRMPVWVTMERIIGTLRARVQLKPDPPFVTKAVCSLVGKPVIRFSCKPLFRNNMNVMGMPLVSNLVGQALDQALQAYMTPRSITIDLEALMVGDTDARDIYALGVILVKVHRVYGFSLEEFGHELSTFVQVGWAKSGDAWYTFRTIHHSTAPRWEETTTLSVGSFEVNAEESLTLDLYRERHNLDHKDLIGSARLKIADIISTQDCAKQWQRRTDPLKCADARRTDINMEWSVAFFPRAPVTLQQLEKQTIYPPIRTHEEFERRVRERVQHKLREAPESAKEEFEREYDATKHEAELKILNNQAPLEEFPSGILQVELPIINFLSVFHAERESDESEQIVYDDEVDQYADRPDSYANIYVNETRLGRTIIKPKDSNPGYGFWNYRFIRSWQNAEVLIVVRDRRVSKSDTLIGAVRIHVGDLFRRLKSPRVRQTYPLEGGVGGGLADVVLTFRPVDMSPPRALTTWEYGTLQLHMPVADEDQRLSENYGNSHMTIWTVLNSTKKRLNPHSDLQHSRSLLPRALTRGKEDADPNHHLVWLPRDKDKERGRTSGHSAHSSTSSLTTNESFISLPIKSKISDRLIFEFETETKHHHKFFSHFSHQHHHDRRRSPEPANRSLRVYACLPLDETVEDDIVQRFTLDVYESYVANWEDTGFEKDEERRSIGKISFGVDFVKGLTKKHLDVMRSHHADVEEILEVGACLPR